MARVAIEFHQLAASDGFELVNEKKLPWLSRHGHLSPAVRSGVPAPVQQSLAAIFRALNGDEQPLLAKTRGEVKADFFWPARNLAIEVDEIQHFTRYRAHALSLYPSGVPLSFHPASYIELSSSLHARAEKSYAHVVVREFPGDHSRARQRAYFDSVRDLCAPYFTAGPLVRVPAYERDAKLVLARFEQLVRGPEAGTATSRGRFVQVAGNVRIVKNYANPVVVVRRPPKA
jgi:hypothetical protein